VQLALVGRQQVDAQQWAPTAPRAVVGGGFEPEHGAAFDLGGELDQMLRAASQVTRL
jgi:hypothetical protein